MTSNPNSQRHLLILTALESEIKAFLRHTRPVLVSRIKKQALYRKVLGNWVVDIGLTGVGVNNCRKFFKKFSVQPDNYKLIVSTGYAGALNSRFKAGDLLTATKVFVENDPVPLQAYEPDFIESTGAVKTTGRTVTAFMNEAEKGQLSRQFPETGFIDMESSEILQIAKESNVKCLVIRAISDPLGMKLPPTPFIVDSWKILPFGAFIKGCFKDPLLLVRFIRFQVALKKAAKSISRALATITEHLRKSHAD